MTNCGWTVGSAAVPGLVERRAVQRHAGDRPAPAGRRSWPPAPGSGCGGARPGSPTPGSSCRSRAAAAPARQWVAPAQTVAATASTTRVAADHTGSGRAGTTALTRTDTASSTSSTGQGHQRPPDAERGEHRAAPRRRGRSAARATTTVRVRTAPAHRSPRSRGSSVSSSTAGSPEASVNRASARRTRSVGFTPRTLSPVRCRDAHRRPPSSPTSSAPTPTRPRVTFYDDAPGPDPRRADRAVRAGPRQLGRQGRQRPAGGVRRRAGLASCGWTCRRCTGGRRTGPWRSGRSARPSRWPRAPADLTVTDDPRTGRRRPWSSSPSPRSPGPTPGRCRRGAMDEARELATYGDQLEAWAEPAGADPALVTDGGTAGLRLAGARPRLADAAHASGSPAPPSWRCRRCWRPGPSTARCCSSAACRPAASLPTGCTSRASPSTWREPSTATPSAPPAVSSR